MKVDVSEVKAYSGCQRQWQFTSRNRMHLRPKVTPAMFALGTLFHEALHAMYMGNSLEKIMEKVRERMSTDNDAALLAMVPGYYNNVLGLDLERYEVLDIEHSFEFEPRDEHGVSLFPAVMVDGEEQVLVVTGSIDMLAIDKETRQLFGFEHKTCKNFRDAAYFWMDEQPRLYTEALIRYVENYNTSRPIEQHISFGGVYINEVKKLLRDFKYNRRLCLYTPADHANFLRTFYERCTDIRTSVENNSYAAPKPDFFKCPMCTYNVVCEKYKYEDVYVEELLEEFGEEFQVKLVDHLDEKDNRLIFI